MNKKHLRAFACMLCFSTYAAANTIIYIDPETGEITSESPVDDGVESRSHDKGLRLEEQPESEPQEKPSPVPGGGMMVETSHDR